MTTVAQMARSCYKEFITDVVLRPNYDQKKTENEMLRNSWYILIYEMQTGHDQ